MTAEVVDGMLCLFAAVTEALVVPSLDDSYRNISIDPSNIYLLMATFI